MHVSFTVVFSLFTRETVANSKHDLRKSREIHNQPVIILHSLVYTEQGLHFAGIPAHDMQTQPGASA